MTTKKKTSKTEKLLEALRSGDVDVRCRAADNPNATPEVLLIALKDKNEWVRENAASNRNATPEVLLVALKDKDCQVRMNAADNPKIKSLNLSTDKWLELVAGGFFEGNLKNVPPHVKKDPRYGSIRLLSKLVQ